MGWLKRLFGMEQPAQAQVNPAPQPAGGGGGGVTAQARTIPPERMGLTGEFDQSGLAKRVAFAFDNAPELQGLEGLWVAQTGSVVVLKGKATNQQVLNKLVEVARGVAGATAVDTGQVTIG